MGMGLLETMSVPAFSHGFHNAPLLVELLSAAFTRQRWRQRDVGASKCTERYARARAPRTFFLRTALSVQWRLLFAGLQTHRY